MFLPRKEEWTICKNFFPNEILILGEFYAMPPWIFPEGIAMLKILAEQVTGFRNFFPIRFFRLPELPGKQWREPHCGDHWH